MNNLSSETNSNLEKYKDNDLIDEEFKNINLEAIDFDLGINSNVKSEPILDNNSLNFSSSDEDKIYIKKKKKSKRYQLQNMTNLKTNFLYGNKSKDKYTEIYSNLLPYANMDKFLVAEEIIENKDCIYYIYVHLKRKKRLFISDFLDSEEIEFNFKKNKIIAFLQSKGNIIFNPFSIDTKNEYDSVEEN